METNDNEIVRKPVKLTFGKRLLYAVLMASSTTMTGINISLEKYFTDKILFSATLFGIAHLVYAIVNSINDPIVGILINRTKDNKKIVKYKRFFFIAIPIFIAGAVFQLVSQPGWPAWLLFLNVFLGLSLMDTGFCTFAISFQTIGLEENLTDSDRAKFTGFNMLVQFLLGAMVYLIPLYFITGDTPQKTTMWILVAIFTAGLILYIAMSFLVKPEIDRTLIKKVDRTGPVMKRIMKDKKFWLFIGISFFVGLIPNIVTLMNTYFLDNVLKLDPGMITIISAVTLPLQLVIFGTAGWMVKKVGIKPLFMISVFGQMAMFLAILFGASGILGIVAMVVISIFSAYWWILSFPLFGNIVDRYTKKYGTVETPVFMGINAILLSPSFSIGTFLFSVVIDAFNYDPLILPPQVQFGIRLAVGGLSTLYLVIGLIFMFFYIRFEKREKAAEMKTEEQ